MKYFICMIMFIILCSCTDNISTGVKRSFEYNGYNIDIIEVNIGNMYSDRVYIVSKNNEETTTSIQIVGKTVKEVITYKVITNLITNYIKE